MRVVRLSLFFASLFRFSFPTKSPVLKDFQIHNS